MIDSGATLVVRPDSGDPVFVVCETLRKLDRAFGSRLNSKGFRVLGYDRPGCVKVIQGDGVDYEGVGQILEAVEKAGYSASNLAFGSGGGLLQKVDRDTQKFAYKCSVIEREVEGEFVTVPVFKDPVTDPGKRSKSGYLDLYRNQDGSYVTINSHNHENSELRIVYLNGRREGNSTLDEIRARATS